MRSVVLDCPDPKALAGFYCAVLGGEVTSVEDDWVLLTADGLRLAFQLVEEFAAPTWPTGERPQQFHLDVTVDDVDAVEAKVLTLGATKREVQPGQAAGDSFRVHLDPAGQPSASAGTDAVSTAQGRGLGSCRRSDAQRKMSESGADFAIDSWAVALESAGE